ncbi:MAG: glycosyltransferase [Acidobacteria bacterium]|nr:glycosyltransferase [Acidobacteriota bacterium]MCI0721147.1 glycosyltransferase [Acidobacteriota bacterium]
MSVTHTTSSPLSPTVTRNVLEFLNRLDFRVRFSKIRGRKLSASDKGMGWRSLEILTLLGEDGTLYEVDVRYAWQRDIFGQNLIDFGWDQLDRLHKKNPHGEICSKLILYLCEPSCRLEKDQTLNTLPEHLLIGCSWHAVHHIYLALPAAHPFESPRTEGIAEDRVYSTTRHLENTSSPVFSGAKKPLLLPPQPGRQGEGGLRSRGLIKSRITGEPLVSVITVVFNGARHLEQAIQSVIHQPYEHLEYIIIDGGSHDGTIELIRRYEGQINYWVSEPDDGIYHAMNKGWEVAQGDFIYHLGSDDVLSTIPAAALRKAFAQGIDLIHGNVYRGDGRLWKSCYGRTLVLYGTTPHQGQFVRRTVCERAPFDRTYRFRADLDFDQRMYRQRRKSLSCDLQIALFRAEGAGSRASQAEVFRAVRNNFGIAAMTVSFALLKSRRLASKVRDCILFFVRSFQ